MLTNKFRPPLRLNHIMFTTALLLIGLASFEMFNYSTTHLALLDLLGSQKFLGIQWATILTIAFCGIDFAGIARLFMPEENTNQHELWYLFGAWLLAATMNALLTWWGISLAIAGHAHASASIVNPGVITNIVPVFVAILVWVTRILLIGSFAASGPKWAAPFQAFSSPHSQRAITDRPAYSTPAYAQPINRQSPSSARAVPQTNAPASRPEPEYIPDPAYTPVKRSPQPLSASSPQKTPGIHRL